MGHRVRIVSYKCLRPCRLTADNNLLNIYVSDAVSFDHLNTDDCSHGAGNKRLREICSLDVLLLVVRIRKHYQSHWSLQCRKALSFLVGRLEWR